MSQFTGLYDIRDLHPSDENFIYATFLRGVYYGNSWFKEIPKAIFMANYKKVAEELIWGQRTIIKIACLKEDPDVIIGYSILSPQNNTIVWVYVKDKWRQKGVGRSLVPINPKSVTNLTELGKQLLSKFDPKPIFNPFEL